MSIDEPTPQTEEDLAQVIQHHIHLRTWGRLQRLQVELSGDRVIVHGYSPSYYVVQLTLRAIREIQPARPVELNLQVIPARPAAPEGGHGFEGTLAWRQDSASPEPSVGSGKGPIRHMRMDRRLQVGG